MAQYTWSLTDAAAAVSAGAAGGLDRLQWLYVGIVLLALIIQTFWSAVNWQMRPITAQDWMTNQKPAGGRMTNEKAALLCNAVHYNPCILAGKPAAS